MSKELIRALEGLDLHGMVEAFARVIESQHSARNPFHNPENADAMLALRELRGLVPILCRLRAAAADETDKHATLTIEAPNGDKIVAHGSPVDMMTLERIFKAAADAGKHLHFIERMAVHHATTSNLSAEEALSWIQHYPPIKAITKSYVDGKVPDTPDLFAAVVELDEFTTDQWWYTELDSVAKTLDQRRAMAVIRNLVRQLEQARSGHALEMQAEQYKVDAELPPMPRAKHFYYSPDDTRSVRKPLDLFTTEQLIAYGREYEAHTRAARAKKEQS